MHQGLAVTTVLMVRDEFPLILDTIGHHLRNLRVDRLIVADNGSTDGTREVLGAMADADARVRVVDRPGGYRQAEIMSELYEMAVDEGADWVLPADADEFLWLHGVDLPTAVADAGDAAAIHIGVTNMVQRRDVLREAPGSIGTMTRSAIPVGSPAEARRLVTDGVIPFVRMQYHPKIMLRARAGVRLRQGQHAADNLDGPIVHTNLAEILHVPIRSYRDLWSRVAHAQRLDDHPERSWHLRRMREFTTADLAREWWRNSFVRGVPSRAWRPDGRLREIAESLAPYRAEVLDVVGTPVALRRMQPSP